MGPGWLMEYQCWRIWHHATDCNSFDATDSIAWNSCGCREFNTMDVDRRRSGGRMVPAKVTALNWTPQLIADFQPSIEANPWRHGSAMDVLQGAMAFEVCQDESRALVAVRPVKNSAGVRLDVMALVSTGDRLDGLAFDAAVTNIAHNLGAKQLAMATIHPHVANACRRAGWIPTGQLMIKILEPIQ